MLLQAPQIEDILRADLGFILRQALDSAALVGGGANQPVGLLATAGVPVLPVATNGGPLTSDIAATMVGMVQGTNTDGTPTFLTNTKVKAAALKLKDAGNNPLGLPVVFGGEPVIYSNQVPSNLTKGTGNGLSALIYGVWADLILAYWSAVDVVLNPYADSVAKKGGAYLHAFLDADVGIRHVDSFAVCKDRTRSGTLRLAEDTRGLAFDLDVPDTTTGRDILALAERGDLGGMSFGFSTGKGGDAWQGDKRELRAVTLHEISVVQAHPAYSGTIVQARHRRGQEGHDRLALAGRYLQILGA